MNLSARFDQVLHYAVLIHAGQLRKGTEIPYLSHLLGVASIAFEYGASEDEAIGALLHDVGEDAGGRGRIEDIRHRFGDGVADIVEGCMDSDGCRTQSGGNEKKNTSRMSPPHHLP